MSETNTHPNRVPREQQEARRTSALQIAAQVNAGTGKSPQEIAEDAKAYLRQITGGWPMPAQD